MKETDNDHDLGLANHKHARPRTMGLLRRDQKDQTMNRIRRAWHHTLQHLGLWQPATPHIRTWDKDMNYLATWQHPQPAHYTWPWKTSRRTWTPGQYVITPGNVHVNVVTDFDQAAHLTGQWDFTKEEQDIMGLQPGDLLGPGIVGLPKGQPGPCTDCPGWQTTMCCDTTHNQGDQ